MAVRVVEEEEMENFLHTLNEAEEELEDRDAILETIYDEFERGLVLLGATAVEDKLQTDVPATINDL